MGAILLFLVLGYDTSLPTNLSGSLILTQKWDIKLKLMHTNSSVVAARGKGVGREVGPNIK